MNKSKRCSEHDLQEQVLLGLLARNAERAEGESAEHESSEDEVSESPEPRLRKKSAKARKVV